MKDVFVDWKPIAELPAELFLFHVETEFKGITILLKELTPEENIVKIVFNSVLCQRITQETGRSRMFHEYGITGFKTSKNSEFLRWFTEESFGIFDEWELTHYLIITEEHVIDVISGLPVLVELTKERYPSA